MMTSCTSRHGFATLLAVWSLLLVGITIACLMRRFSTEATRTQEETDRAQLRQMVIAGTLSKPASPVKLPEELQKLGGNLTVRIDKNDSMTVDAGINRRHERWFTKISE